MALIVTRQFHINNVLKEIGDELSAKEEKLIRDMVAHEDADIAGSGRELLHRCVQRAESVVESVAAAAEKALKKIDPVQEPAK